MHDRVDRRVVVPLTLVDRLEAIDIRLQAFGFIEAVTRTKDAKVPASKRRWRCRDPIEQLGGTEGMIPHELELPNLLFSRIALGILPACQSWHRRQESDESDEERASEHQPKATGGSLFAGMSNLVNWQGQRERQGDGEDGLTGRREER